MHASQDGRLVIGLLADLLGWQELFSFCRNSQRQLNSPAASLKNF